MLSPEAAGPPIVAYAHVVRDENPAQITIQYWLFYYYNDWFNKHEGDWESVQVTLDAAGKPQWVVLSQHHGGTRRPWSATQVVGGTHPAVYVALGSHANYFWGDETYPNGTTIGNARLEIMDRTGSAGEVLPNIMLIPDREPVAADPTRWRGREWLSFGGRWGQTAPQKDFGGPYGPPDKGDQWDRPYAWGMDQPLDVDTWYAHRLRVEVIGAGANGAHVTLHDEDHPSGRGGDTLASAETLGPLALLHADPAPGTAVVAEIQVSPGRPFDLLATWPDVETSQVTRYLYYDVLSGDLGRATLTLRADAPPALVVEGTSQELSPAIVEIEPATWDAPDLVWLAGMLPATDVAIGVLISLLAGMLPTAMYVGILYGADRYEKEPTAMLAAAFLWGAIPALLVAVGVRLFFQLPVELLGPKAIEAVRAGLIAPLIEEALKAVVVLYLAVRYRLEFDDVLDGIIYGAMVGFGFAMTGNVISYLGAFLLRGFAGLSSTIFVEGVLYGLNHALYSAIFGAGLGYARLARERWQRWAVPLAAFALAVACNALHSLAVRTAIGLNPWTVAITWAGVVVIVVVVVWSLRRQHQWLTAELVDEIPEELYHTLTARGGRRRAQWQALRLGGFTHWRRARHVHQQCAELAIKKAQCRRRLDDRQLRQEVERLRRVVTELASQPSV
jgi:RsiW-degrading membrane proteinase PrsW (M82 family)